MNESEFDVLDELYFVVPYSALETSMEMDRPMLIRTLTQLHQKGWIRVLSSPEDEVFESVDLEKDAETYYYLASKRGLLAHNTN